MLLLGFPDRASGKELPASAGDVRDESWIPGLGRSHGGGHGNPLQYFFFFYFFTEFCCLLSKFNMNQP